MKLFRIITAAVLLLAATSLSAQPTQRYKLTGSIGQYPVTMYLNLPLPLQDGFQVGTYSYDSNPNSVFSLFVEYSDDYERSRGWFVTMNEYSSSGKMSGTFEGNLDWPNDNKVEFSGTFTNSKGRSFPFSIKSVKRLTPTQSQSYDYNYTGTLYRGSDSYNIILSFSEEYGADGTVSLYGKYRYTNVSADKFLTISGFCFNGCDYYIWTDNGKEEFVLEMSDRGATLTGEWYKYNNSYERLADMDNTAWKKHLHVRLRRQR